MSNTRDANDFPEERIEKQELRLADIDPRDRATRELQDDDILEMRDRTPAPEGKPIITPPVPADRSDRTQRAERNDSAAEQGAPVTDTVPHAGFGTSDLSGQEAATADERWNHIQAEFVDDPRKAVGEAHELVGEMVQQLVDAFTKERNELKQQWSNSSSVSTEDLRICLQHYRAFFARLSSPSANGVLAQP